MLSGAFTAIVTPFNQDQSIDFGRFRELIDVQIGAGIDGIVPVGTTGESPTLSFEEHHHVIDAAVEAAAGRIKVIAGTGGNSTAEAIELTRHAKDAGADATLQVTPYYNKPSQEGLFRHFSAIADLGLPVMLYNVPGRSGREIEVDTVVRLAQHEHVVAVKEAAGGPSIDRTSEICSRCDIDVISGDDSLTLPMMIVGAKGVISVASNLIPQVVADMVHAGLEGNWSQAQQLHGAYFPLFNALLSVDSNPIPIKAAMAMTGMLEETYRLPLCPLSDAARATLSAALSGVSLINECKCGE